MKRGFFGIGVENLKTKANLGTLWRSAINLGADFIFVGDEPHFIELNMVPGLSAESILPKQAKEAGITLAALFESTLI